MTHQEASTVIPLRLVQARTRLNEVENWTRFMIGVDRVTRTAHERYTFRLADRRGGHDCRMVVRGHVRADCLMWHSLDHEPFEGSIALKQVDAWHTRVSVSATVREESFMAGLAAMIGAAPRTCVDLRRLEATLCDSIASP